jgi:hypothetical protein
MAIHEDELSMLRESLPEYLRLARIGIETKKENGGVLGYPSATILFAVVDAIGSHLRKAEGVEVYTVTVEGKPRPISGTAHHFHALNSPYFGLDLKESEIERLYNLSRSPLTHNARLGFGVRLTVDRSIPEVFVFQDGVLTISLPDLLKRCEVAVEAFLADGEKVVAESASVEELRMKALAPSNAEAMKKLEELAASGGWGQSAQASAMDRPSAPRTWRGTNKPR